MPRYILFILLFILFMRSNAQIERTYHWYFGRNAGIDFCSSTAVPDTNGMVNTWDGCATMSDTVGNLLFYTDGSTVWNRNHQAMMNGTGLLGHWSSHQNSIIVPKPNSSEIYYIFTTDALENNFANGLQYSIVDMSYDGGLGAIIEKNTPLVAPTHEQLGAVFHSNCTDIWVLTHKRDEEKFYAYLVTENGVDTTPVISNIGNASTLLAGCFGFTISSNGESLLSGNFRDWWSTGQIDDMELYDFNRSAGVLSNMEILYADTANTAFSFSSDNSKLYVVGSGSTQRTTYYQFDLTASDINASRQVVFETNNNLYYPFDAQLSPLDDKIYITNADRDSLIIINHSNANGLACDIATGAFYLDGKLSAVSFPNFISSYFDRSETSCFKKDSTIIPVEDFYTPNIFSPNNDGQNDVWYIRGEYVKEITEVRIYDRWGQELFHCACTAYEAENPCCGWNGTYHGKQVENDVYIYYVQVVYKSGNSGIKSGSITLEK